MAQSQTQPKTEVTHCVPQPAIFQSVVSIQLFQPQNTQQPRITVREKCINCGQ